MSSLPYKAAKCPVCGMWVEIPGCRFKLRRQGVTHYFCAESCLRTFSENPDRYTGNGKGRWGRYLERMAKANKRAFGSGGPKCC